MYSIIIGIWSELSIRLGVIFNLFAFSPFITVKSSKSGVLFKSVGQYVGLSVNNILWLLVLIYFSNVLPRGVLILEPHSVYFALKSLCDVFVT